MFSMAFCTDGLFLSLSVFIILIGYFGLRQKEIFTNFPVEDFDTLTESKTKYAGLVLKETDVAQYAIKIKNYMDTDKPYLDADLTLQQLASSLEIPSHHLSRVVNEKFGYHFFDFINHYRVEEVKIKISDPKFQNYSLLGVAFECGFNSKSAFNRVFKKTTGLTPSEYQKSNK
jgi:AraC-like DNA-binding protein